MSMQAFCSRASFAAAAMALFLATPAPAPARGVQAPQAEASVACVANLASKTGGDALAGLALASDGHFYGTTSSGGRHGFGTIFSAWPNGTVKVMHDLSLNTGDEILYPLVQASDGALYGGSIHGGASNCGTLFRLGLDRSFAVIHTFDCHGKGGGAWGRLIQARDGFLYGVSALGGPGGKGMVYRLSLDGDFEVVALFTDESGKKPEGALLEADDGSFYGTTTAGGANGIGTLFNVTPTGTLTVLHDFTKQDSDFARGTLAYTAAHDRIVGTTTTHIFEWSAGELQTFPTNGWALSPLVLGLDGTTFYAFADIGGSQTALVQLGADLVLQEVVPIRRTPLLRAGPEVATDGGLWGVTPTGGRKHGQVYRVSVP